MLHQEGVVSALFLQACGNHPLWDTDWINPSNYWTHLWSTIPLKVGGAAQSVDIKSVKPWEGISLHNP